jgi:dihydrofolate reductase
MHSSRELIVYIAMSLDGYIAGENDDLSFLNAVAAKGEDYGYQAFVDTVDTVLMGRKTYEVVKTLTDEFPREGRRVYVITQHQDFEDEQVTFISEALAPWMQKLKAETGKHIFCDGGAHTVQNLLRSHLIDRFIISVIPVILGKGTSLFASSDKSYHLQLEKSESWPSGLVQLNYRVIYPQG